MPMDWTQRCHMLLSGCGVTQALSKPAAERFCNARHLHILRARTPSFFPLLDVNEFNWTWNPLHHHKNFQHYLCQWKKRKAVKYFTYNFNCYESLMVIKMALNFLSLTCANKVSLSKGTTKNLQRSSAKQPWWGMVHSHFNHEPWYKTVTLMEGSKLKFPIKTGTMVYPASGSCLSLYTIFYFLYCRIYRKWNDFFLSTPK